MTVDQLRRNLMKSAAGFALGGPLHTEGIAAYAAAQEQQRRLTELEQERSQIMARAAYELAHQPVHEQVFSSLEEQSKTPFLVRSPAAVGISYADSLPPIEADQPYDHPAFAFKSTVRSDRLGDDFYINVGRNCDWIVLYPENPYANLVIEPDNLFFRLNSMKVVSLSSAFIAPDPTLLIEQDFGLRLYVHLLNHRKEVPSIRVGLQADMDFAVYREISTASSLEEVQQQVRELLGPANDQYMEQLAKASNEYS